MIHHRAIASKLPAGARDLLIEHIDGPNFINVKIVAGERVASRTALMDRELICYSSSSARPTSTVITEDGRYVLAIILAKYAEALIRAGYGVEAEVACAVRDDAIVLFEQHVKALPLPSGQSDASPSPAVVSSPEPTVQPQPQIAESAAG